MQCAQWLRPYWLCHPLTLLLTCAPGSYGYHRVEVLGALASVLMIWLVTGILVVEAIQRIINPEEVNGKSEGWRGRELLAGWRQDAQLGTRRGQRQDAGQRGPVLREGPCAALSMLPG